MSTVTHAPSWLWFAGVLHLRKVLQLRVHTQPTHSHMGTQVSVDRSLQRMKVMATSAERLINGRDDTPVTDSDRCVMAMCLNVAGYTNPLIAKYVKHPLCGTVASYENAALERTAIKTRDDTLTAIRCVALCVCVCVQTVRVCVCMHIFLACADCTI
jgi:hypothetical protein